LGLSAFAVHLMQVQLLPFQPRGELIEAERWVDALYRSAEPPRPDEVFG
jgi:hypothetical protein